MEHLLSTYRRPLLCDGHFVFTVEVIETKPRLEEKKSMFPSLIRDKVSLLSIGNQGTIQKGRIMKSYISSSDLSNVIVLLLE